MNGPAVPAAAPRAPGRRRGARCGLIAVPLTPARALALVGLALAGAVLFTVAVGSAALAAIPLVYLLQSLLSHSPRLAGAPGQLLLAVLIGVACCRFLLPGTLLAARRLVGLTRRLLARWCGADIGAAYRPAPVPVPPAGGSPGAAGAPGGMLDLVLRGPGGIGYRRRITWLLNDPATWKDLAWLLVSAVAGPVLLLGPLVLAVGAVCASVANNLSPLAAGALVAWPWAVRPGRCGPTPTWPGWCSPLPGRPSSSSGWPTWPRPGRSRSTPGRPSCGGSSATCTTAPRPAWSRWG